MEEIKEKRKEERKSGRDRKEERKSGREEEWKSGRVEEIERVKERKPKN